MPTLPDHDRERLRMVKEQIQRRGLKSPRVLEAFRKVPRHLFVWEVDRDLAYADQAVRIAHGQTISQPYIVALMTDELALTGVEKVLEIGTGSGYQTAILAELAREVYTIERIPDLLEKARALLDSLGYRTVRYKIADGTAGWPEKALFDRILVAAGSPKVPQALLDQLAPGGRMIIPIGGEDQQDLCRVVKNPNGRIVQTTFCPCRFVKLIGQEGWTPEQASE